MCNGIARMWVDVVGVTVNSPTPGLSGTVVQAFQLEFACYRWQEVAFL